MSKAEDYRARLSTLDTWDSYLLKESGLPGPRGNIELAQVVADMGTLSLFKRYIAYTADRAPVNTPEEFLAFCGTVGLGRLLAEGDPRHLKTLRVLANDSRWRIREGVAMALQRLGDVDMSQLVDAMQIWSAGTPLEQRAAAAALCEPRLLHRPEQAKTVLKILDDITDTLDGAAHPTSVDVKALHKGLGYCWSVAVVALPDVGKTLMEKWLVRDDKVVRWIMRENLKKNRLARMDSSWVAKWQSRIKA